MSGVSKNTFRIVNNIMNEPDEIEVDTKTWLYLNGHYTDNTFNQG